MGPVDIVLRLVIGLVMGFIIGLTGVGAGVLVVPVLVTVLRLPASVAVGTASLFATVTKVFAGYKHTLLGNVQWRACAWFLLGALPANLLVAYLLNRALASMADDAARLAAFQGRLSILLTLVVIGAAAYMILNLFLNRAADAAQARGENRPDEKTPRPAGLERILAVLAGLVTGSVMGSTSVSAVMVVPLIMSIFRLSPRKTVGSAIIIALVLSLATAIMYSGGNQTDYATALLMGLSALLGANLGARCTARIPRGLMRLILAVVVCGACALMLLKPDAAAH